jgi:hypothetical protein
MSYVATYEVEEKLEEFFFETADDVITDIQDIVPPFDAEDPEDVEYILEIVRRTILIQWRCDNGCRVPLEFEDLLKATASNHARLKLDMKIAELCGKSD